MANLKDPNSTDGSFTDDLNVQLSAGIAVSHTPKLIVLYLRLS